MTATAQEGTLNTLTVRHLGGDRFAIAARDHVVTVDQPLEDGGDDSAMTPTEMFVAGLIGCVAFYARRYLARHEIPTTGLVVTGQYDMADRPARVADIHIEIV